MISESPTDVQPVFDAIADSAARLCEANDAEIYRVDGSVYRRVAHRGPVPIAGPVGETYPIKIIKLSPAERKIGLSIRALKSDEFRADWEAYQESAGDGAATLGDHFRNR